MDFYALTVSSKFKKASVFMWVSFGFQYSFFIKTKREIFSIFVWILIFFVLSVCCGPQTLKWWVCCDLCLIFGECIFIWQKIIRRQRGSYVNDFIVFINNFVWLLCCLWSFNTCLLSMQSVSNSWFLNFR